MICFFSENGHKGGVPRNFNNMRTEFAWQLALSAYHESFDSLSDDTYSVGIVILPKNKGVNFDAVKEKCNYIGVMQEGPHDFYQDYPVSEQKKYLAILEKADFLLCHNEYDLKYYEGLFPQKPVFTLKSLLVEESLNELTKKGPKERKDTMVGGTFCSWYGGSDSAEIARVFPGDISIPMMGRMLPDERSENSHINYLPFAPLSNFLKELNNYKYAVHLMKTYAAGTFALACARLQIPCIGYNNCDTQRILFPKLSVDQGDLKSAREIANKLVNKPGFYQHVADHALKAYGSNYSEDRWLTQASVKHILSLDEHRTEEVQ